MPTEKRLTPSQKRRRIKQRGYCKKWRKSHPEYSREASRKWNKKHPDKHYASSLAWKKKNPEKAKIIGDRASRAWKARNPEHAHAYYLKNQKRLLKKSSEYIKTHPEIRIAKIHKRRARESGNGGEFTAQQWVALKLLYKNRCLCCRRKESTLMALGLCLAPDHVISVSKGGSSDISNIQTLCHGKGGCNNRKGARNIDYR